MIVTLSAFKRAWQNHHTGAVHFLAGRVMHGFDEAGDFGQLANKPGRPFTFAVGSEGLSYFLKCQQLESSGLKAHLPILASLAYTPDYVRHLLQCGEEFRLFVFKKPPICYPATWDGVAQLVRASYPGLAPKFCKHLPILKKHSFSWFENRTDFVWADVYKNGHDDPRYLVADRYEDAPDTAEYARLFVYCSLFLNEEFTGDGKTAGSPPIAEFFVRNMFIDELGCCLQLPLTLT